MFARRGHQRCHCNEEGFGTLSRQLGNDEGYRSSRAGVSGLSPDAPVPQMAAAAAVEEARTASDTGRGFDPWAGSAPRSNRSLATLPPSSSKHAGGDRRLIEL